MAKRLWLIASKSVINSVRPNDFLSSVKPFWTSGIAISIMVWLDIAARMKNDLADRQAGLKISNPSSRRTARHFAYKSRLYLHPKHSSNIG